MSTAWRERAQCKDAPTEVFYPLPKSRDAKYVIAVYCTPCPVRAECLGRALDAGLYEQHGIWGGKTADQRMALLRHAKATV